jgi:hypothetical protein
MLAATYVIITRWQPLKGGSMSMTVRLATSLVLVLSFAFAAMTATGIAAPTKKPSPYVICANCTDGNYPPPVACNSDTGDFATSWQGHTWYCQGSRWFYGG